VGWGDEGDAGGGAGAAAPEQDAGGQAGAAPPPTKRQRRRAKAEEEARVRAAELRQLAAPAPQSAGDFEKLARAPRCPSCCAGTPLVGVCMQVELRAGAPSKRRLVVRGVYCNQAHICVPSFYCSLARVRVWARAATAPRPRR